MLKIVFLLTLINVLSFAVEKTSKTKNEKPPVDCFDGGFFQKPNPKSCNSFYKCDSSGTPILFQCPDNLEYSPTLNVCTWKDQAGCTVNSEKNYNQNQPKPSHQNSSKKPDQPEPNEKPSNSNNIDNSIQDGKGNNNEYYLDMMFLD